VTSRLLSLAKQNWAAFDGEWASQNLDPLDLPIDRFLSLVYWWMVRNAEDEKAIKSFDTRLWRPPPGEAPAEGSPWTPEAETSAFRAFSAEFRGSVESGGSAG
jgi:hypothetical protein